MWGKVKGVAGKIFGKKTEKLDPKTQKEMKIGLDDLKVEQKKHVNEKGEISFEDAEGVAKKIKKKHSVFKFIKVRNEKNRAIYKFKVNPEFEYEGPKIHQLSVEQLYKKYAYKGSAVYWYKGIYPDRTLTSCMSGGFLASSTANRSLSPSNRITDTGWHYGSTDKSVAWNSKFTFSYKGIVFKLKNTGKCVDVYKNYTGYASGNSPEIGELARWYRIPTDDIIGFELWLGNKIKFIPFYEYDKFTIEMKRTINFILTKELHEREKYWNYVFKK